MTKKIKIESKIENGKLYIREVPKDIRKEVGGCFYCREPVYVSSGQLLNYKGNSPTHKKCRKQNDR